MNYPLLDYAGPVERQSFWRSETGSELIALGLIAAFLLTYFALLTAAILVVDFALLYGLRIPP